MKVSGFTFLRNGQKLGYPFVASIRSILPLVDEFVIALGPCDDGTEKMIRAIGDASVTAWRRNVGERARVRARSGGSVGRKIATILAVRKTWPACRHGGRKIRAMGGAPGGRDQRYKR